MNLAELSKPLETGDIVIIHRNISHQYDLGLPATDKEFLDAKNCGLVLNEIRITGSNTRLCSLTHLITGNLWLLPFWSVVRHPGGHKTPASAREGYFQ